MSAGEKVTLRRGDRVLVTRLDFLGDVVLSLPLVDAIAAAHPGVEIDYLTRRPAADLIAPEPRFARVFALARGGGLADSLRLILALRRRRYRAVIDLYSNPRSAWLSWFSGAPVRIGGDRRGRRHLYTHPMRVTGARAASAHHLCYAEPLGIDGAAGRPTLTLSAEETARARETLRESGLEGTSASGPVVGIHPGGKWSVKRWPGDRFAGLVRLLREELGARVVVFSGPGEEHHTEAVRREVGDAAVYPGVLPVREVAAAIAVLDAMVACDGGIMHVSVAAGTPTVGIFGSAEPEVWFPYASLGPYRAAYLPMECRPCHRHECPLGHTDCLNRLTARHVFDDVKRVLSRAGAGG